VGGLAAATTTGGLKMQLPPPSIPPQQRPQTTGLEPNVAAMLSYLVPLPPVTAVIFLLIEKEDRFVRFHAMQGALFGAVCLIAVIALQLIAAALGTVFRPVEVALSLLVALLGTGVFFLWIVMMVKAYQGKAFKLPVIGDEAARRV
jgi:uncharacterized membrane protein